MVSLVYLKMVRQVSNPFAEKSDLNFWRTRVPLVALELFDDLFFLLLNECHEIPPY
jgi:hypothetical protein